MDERLPLPTHFLFVVMVAVVAVIGLNAIDPMTAHAVYEDGDPVVDCLIAQDYHGDPADGTEAVHAPISAIRACTP